MIPSVVAQELADLRRLVQGATDRHEHAADTVDRCDFRWQYQDPASRLGEFGIDLSEPTEDEAFNAEPSADLVDVRLSDHSARDRLALDGLRSAVTSPDFSPTAFHSLNPIETTGTPPLSDERIPPPHLAAPTSHPIFDSQHHRQDRSPTMSLVRVVVGRLVSDQKSLVETATGELLTLDRAAGDPLDLVVDGRLFARAELIRKDGALRLRICELIGRHETGVS